MDVVLVSLHYVLHFAHEQLFPVLADEDQMAFEIPLVPSATLVFIVVQMKSSIRCSYQAF